MKKIAGVFMVVLILISSMFQYVPTPSIDLTSNESATIDDTNNYIINNTNIDKKGHTNQGKIKNRQFNILGDIGIVPKPVTVYAAYYGEITVSFIHWLISDSGDRYYTTTTTTKFSGDIVVASSYKKKIAGYTYSYANYPALIISQENNVISLYYTQNAPTATPSPTPTPLPTPSPSPIPTPSPTPTPRTVSVKHFTEAQYAKGDYIPYKTTFETKYDGDTVSADSYKENIDGYTFSSAKPDNLVVNGEENIISLYYNLDKPQQRNVEIKHYLEEGYATGEYRYEKSAPVVVSDGITIKAINYKQAFSGYSFAFADKSSIKVNADNIIISLYYTLNLPKDRIVRFYHYTETGIATGDYLLTDKADVSISDGKNINAKDYIKKFKGFTYSHATPDNITVSAANNNISLYYNMDKPDITTLTVKHYLESAKGSNKFVISKITKFVASSGMDITSSKYKQIFTGYTFKYADQDNITISDDANTIKLYYKKR